MRRSVDPSPGTDGPVHQGHSRLEAALGRHRPGPLTNPLVESGVEGIESLGSLIPPAAQIVLDQRYNKCQFTGQPYRVKGNPQQAKKEDLGTRARILTDDVASVMYAC